MEKSYVVINIASAFGVGASSRGRASRGPNQGGRAWRPCPCSNFFAPGPAARYDHAAVAVGDSTLVVVGGRNPTGTSFKDMWALDISTKTWISVGELSTPLYGLAAASVGSDIYVLGGYNKEDGFLTSLHKCSATGSGILLTYTCVDITLGCQDTTGAATLVNVGYTPRYQHSMFTYKTDIFVYGGVRDDESAVSGDVKLYKLDTATCSWSVANSDLCRHVKPDTSSSDCVLYEGVAGPTSHGMFIHGGFNSNGLTDQHTYVYPL